MKFILRSQELIFLQDDLVSGTSGQTYDLLQEEHTME